MSGGPIVSVRELQALIAEGGLLLLDCDFDLADPALGLARYRQGHLPGARHVDLERDLSGLPDGSNGRHPLPSREAFAATVRRLGLATGQQVVAYDGSGGIYAARLWWMLRWLGHGQVAVLDGGKQAWVRAGLSLETGELPSPVPGDIVPGNSLAGPPASAAEILADIGKGALQVVDARDPARFGGAPHPLDTVPGHIPGATNRFYAQNLDEAGLLRPAQELAAAFRDALGGKLPQQAVMQCGSGVTACHNLLAMEVAGLKGARLYPGSWSEWTADPTRPVER